MKKVIVTLLISLVFVVSALSIEWKTANQATVQWDAVTTLSDGNPVPADNSVKYRVYLANAVTDPDKTNPSLLTTNPISTLEYIITLNTEGKYYIGVSAVRYDSTGAEIADTESDINWSDTNGESTPNPFGLVYYIKMGAPKNLR
jgi:hypothetical protein